MSILDDYKNGVFYIELKNSIQSLADLDSKVENIHDVMEAFFQFSPKEKWEKLETTLYILYEFSKFVDKNIFKNVLLEVESLFKENNKRFILDRNILYYYLSTLNKYLEKSLGAEDCQDFFNENSIFFTIINRIKNQELNGIDRVTCSRMLSIMIIIFEKGEGFERLKEKIKQDLGSIMDIILLEFLFAGIIISYFDLDILVKIFKSEHLYLINSFYKINPDDLSVRFYLSWLETKDSDIIKESIETLQTILKYTDSDILKNEIFSLLEKAGEIKNENEEKRNIQDIQVDELGEIGNTLIDEIRFHLTIKARDLENTEEYGHYTKIETLTNHLIKTIKSGESSEPAYLRLTNSKQLNDPMEGRAIYDYLEIENSSDCYQSSNVFLSSMTTISDSLPMWKEYAEESKGAFLQYDKKYLQQIIEHESLEFVRIFYLNSAREDDSDILHKLNDLKELVQELKARNTEESMKVQSNIFKNLAKISYLFKVSDYEYESEYRILINFDDSEIEGRLNPELKTEDKIELEELKVLSGSIGLSKNEESGYDDFRKYIHLESKEDGRYALFVYINLLPLKYSKVILGPKVTDADYIAPYLKLANPDIEIESSKIPYR
ncbi:DUF2971 domain-containing protein [Streptococcus sp. CF4-2]|uniref:DUF2971 domain-containing protein n=1 Tax=unclassified Streptococcus TaxID=2608887 RepID=UPI0020C9B6FA|nr:MULTISPECIES: DUF2971 domain-containing protein [unclassified Streptococcus]MCP9076347.1 DUF2971 domain-containing protein [Streptococcus sp. CF4-3]MCP9089032.1 DUF2971 domain-containing protein [Streptococcus sp. CF4-2]